jgi:hypothetical protein
VITPVVPSGISSAALVLLVVTERAFVHTSINLA